MEKTYKFVDHISPLPVAEIRKIYKGYWVFLTQAKFNERKGLVSGIPIIVGKTPFDGAEDGIYDEYRGIGSYGKTADMNLLPSSGFISAFRIVGEERPA